MIEEKTVWFVTGDPDGRLFPYKIDAEARARQLFPNESTSQRYARVFYRIVGAEEPESTPDAPLGEDGWKVPAGERAVLLDEIAAAPRVSLAGAKMKPLLRDAPRFIVDRKMGTYYVLDARTNTVVGEPFLSKILAQEDAARREGVGIQAKDIRDRCALWGQVGLLREGVEHAMGRTSCSSQVEEALSAAVHALQDAERLLEE